MAAVPRALRDALVAYEPRLTQVNVSRLQGDEGVIQFEISARLAVPGSKASSMVFRTKVGSGAMAVEG